MLNELKLGGAEEEVEHIVGESARGMLCGDIVSVCWEVVPVKKDSECDCPYTLEYHPCAVAVKFFSVTAHVNAYSSASGFRCGFEHGIKCTEECWQIVHVKACDIVRKRVADKAPELPPFAIR